MYSEVKQTIFPSEVQGRFKMLHSSKVQVSHNYKIYLYFSGGK